MGVEEAMNCGDIIIHVITVDSLQETATRGQMLAHSIITWKDGRSVNCAL
jgi:hypothetical protein